MRKNVTAVLSIVSLSLLLAACNDNKQVTMEPKQLVGVVDTMRIYSDSKAGLEGSKYLEKLQINMQDELTALQEEIQTNPSEQSIALFQEKYTDFQERITLEQEQVVETLNTALQEAMDTYRKDHGLEILVASEMVMSMSKSSDVTDGIVKVLDSMKVEFKPVVMPEKPAAPVLEQAAPETTPEQAEGVAEQNITEPETTPESAPETAPTTPEVAQ